jgi:hypothetical protein
LVSQEQVEAALAVIVAQVEQAEVQVMLFRVVLLMVVLDQAVQQVAVAVAVLLLADLSAERAVVVAGSV